MGVPKTYIYISETKVDQFFEQLASSDIEKLGAEYGVDVKIFKWVGHREAERILTKQMKLNRVVEFLRNSDELGSPSAPLRYFAGVLQMRWGALYDKAVIFVGETSKEIIVLAGALNHVIGVAGPPAGGIGASRKVGAVQIFSEAIDKALLSDSKEVIHRRPRTPSGESDEDVLYKALFVARHFEAPRQQLEFIAKTHAFGKVELPQNWIASDGQPSKLLVLGTPFYEVEA